VQPGKFVGKPVLARLFEGVTLALTDAKLATGKADVLQLKQAYWVEGIAWDAGGIRWFATATAQSDGGSTLVAIDSDGSTHVLKHERRGTAWFNSLRVSPDGRHLAFTKRVYRSDLMLLEGF